MQYQGGNKGASRLGVKANHNEIPLHYEVTNAHGINGNVIAEEDISSQLLAIALDGTVTQKGAGIADITVSLPESSGKKYEYVFTPDDTGKTAIPGRALTMTESGL